MDVRLIGVEFSDIVKKEILSLVNECKFRGRSRVPEDKLILLVKTFESCGRVSLSFSDENPLSVMETVIIALFLLEKKDEEISSLFNISKNTVRRHVEKIKEKLEVSGRVSALAKSIRLGILKAMY